MKFTMEIKVGKNVLSITEDCEDTKDLFKKAGFYGTIPAACGNCESENLMLNHRCAQGKYDYYSVDCKACGHRLNYGQHLDDNTLFAKLADGWEAPYASEDDEEAPKTSSKKKTGKSALEKAKAAKSKAKTEEVEEENVEEEEEAETKKASATNKRAALLNKFKKKGA